VEAEVQRSAAQRNVAQRSEENNSLLETWYVYYPKGVEDCSSGI
jgi:hypothetical protein